MKPKTKSAKQIKKYLTTKKKSPRMLIINNINTNISSKIKDKLFLSQTSVDRNLKFSNKSSSLKKQNSNFFEKDRESNNLTRINNTQKYFYEKNPFKLASIKSISKNSNLNSIQSDTSNRTTENETTEKFLQYIRQIQDNYDKEILKKDQEIKNLLERNDKLEELVLKLKDTLDNANEIFPEFLEQIIKTNNNTRNSKNNYSMISEGIDPISIIDNNKNTKMDDEINILQKKIEEYEKKITNLIEDQHQYIFQINTLSEEVQQKCEEIKILDEKIKVGDNVKKENGLLIKNLKTELEKMAVENNDNKNNLEKEKSENQNLTLLIESLTKDHEEKFNNQEMKYDQINENYSKIKKEYERILKENKTLNGQIGSYAKLKDNIVIEKNKEIKKIQELKNDIENKYKSVNEENEKLKNDLNTKNKEIQNKNNQIKLISKNNNELINVKDQLSNTKTNQNGDNLKLNADNEKIELSIQINKLQEEYNTLNDQYKNLENEYNLIKSENIELKNNIQNNICTLNEKLIDNNLQENINMYESKIKMLMENLKLEKEENSKNNDLLEDLKIKINSEVNKNNEFEKQIKLLFEEIKNNKIKIKNLNKINSSFQNKESSIKKELLSKNNLIKSLQEKLAINHTIIEDEEFNQLVEENEELKKINKELLEKINESGDTTHTKITENDTNNLNEKQNRLILEQKKEIESLHIKFEQLYKELNKYRLKNTDLNNQIQKMQENYFNDNKSINSPNENNAFKLNKNFGNEIEKLD